ncbi:hypothetical protein B0H14DRAFT_2568563 [Mycena olivaceomarginata]|nr:hypothetical protein B0H14DRAFT_2568563 [Mycena olivaceomarginata]
MPEIYGMGESDSWLRTPDSPRESVKCELVGTSLDSKQTKYLVTYCPNDQELPEDGHEAERDEVQNEIIPEMEPVWMTPEGKERIPPAVDLETGIPEVKTQYSEMQDFSEPGLKDVESGKLQKSAEAAIGRARFFGGEIREISADAKENDKKCRLLQVAKNQALYRNPYLKHGKAARYVLDHSRWLDARGRDEQGMGIRHASLGDNLMHDYDCLPLLRILRLSHKAAVVGGIRTHALADQNGGRLGVGSVRPSGGPGIGLRATDGPGCPGTLPPSLWALYLRWQPYPTLSLRVSWLQALCFAAAGWESKGFIIVTLLAPKQQHPGSCRDEGLCPEDSGNGSARPAEENTAISLEPGHHQCHSPMDVDNEVPDQEVNLSAGPRGSIDPEATPSRFYIETIPHPHNDSAAASYISLDNGVTPGGPPEDPDAPSKPFVAQPAYKPWAPFRTRADFEYAESVVLPNMERKWVDVQLAGIAGEWSNSPSNITFRNYAHMEKTLAAARTYRVQFQTGHVEADFDGVTYKFEFQYRDPWKWIVDLLSDPTLASDIHWHPVRKFLFKDGVKVQLFDEPYTANKWWNIQNNLPHIPGLPHCFIPIALWLDKGMVTKRVRKHPIVLRALFLDGNIRNASGNGGGVLIGYMVIPIDPSDSADRNAAKALDWARFKREVFKILFGPLLGPAKHGETLTCGDEIKRVCYPGIPVTSIDGEEACSVSACRAALANCPCPRCLVHHNDLAKICKSFTLRTTETMRRKYEDAIAAPTKSERESILQSVGLHATENFFWSLPNSDPYCTNSYDLLHSDESGKWGKHIWPLLLDYEERSSLAELEALMSPPKNTRMGRHFLTS